MLTGNLATCGRITLLNRAEQRPLAGKALGYVLYYLFDRVLVQPSSDAAWYARLDALLVRG